MDDVASFNAIIYGMGGVGKTTMASTFPKPLLLDFENGSKYFKQRGIELDTIQFSNWINDEDKTKLIEIIKNYETIIIDPIGRAMQNLIDDKKSIQGTKYRQSGSGDLTQAGWGEAKKIMRNFINYLLSTNKNILLISHITEDKDDSTGMITKRPMMPTGLKDEIITMVDVVSYLGNNSKKNDDGTEEIVRYLDMRTGQNHVSKDRTGKLNNQEFNGFVKPEWSFIKELLKGENKIKSKKIPVKKEKIEDVSKINPFDKKKGKK